MAIPGSASALPPLEREVDLQRHVIALVQQRLPAGWSTTVLTGAKAGDRGVDALLEVTGSDRQRVLLVLEVKGSLATRDLPRMLEQMRPALSRFDEPVVPVLASRYLSPSARAWLEERDVSYVDATGNLRIVADRPALFLRDTGSDHDPWRGPGRRRETLQGPPAARVVRALVVPGSADLTAPGASYLAIR